MNDQVYSGISGLQVPIPKYKFPPEYQASSRLTYYASFFNSIEVNSSFYKIPMPLTTGKWANTVPEHFKFTFKLYQEVTHGKGLGFKRPDIDLFYTAINQVGAKKGCILVQFPPSIGKEYVAGINDILACMHENDPSRSWKIAVEFRNKSLYQPGIYDLLNGYNAALVIQDIPKSATPMISQTLDFVYIRFHGPTGTYRGSYPESFLYEYAGYIREWLEEGKTVYVYFNNTIGDAFNNLQTLNKYL